MLLERVQHAKHRVKFIRGIQTKILEGFGGRGQRDFAKLLLMNSLTRGDALIKLVRFDRCDVCAKVSQHSHFFR